MADPLSVTASIIAVLQLSSTVLKYLVNVKDASADRKSLIREISSIRGILSTLNETVDDARVSDETWSATIRSLEDPDGPLRVLTTKFQQLATTLNGSASATGIKKAANSLRWPFKQSEVEKILRVIERQKSTLSLALENDHITLSREICNNTEAIRDDVAGLSREFAAVRLDAKTDTENAILNQLPYANGAPFNAFRRDYERDCLPDTRVELLNQIMTWGNKSDGPCIFWLNGMAGTGKSTISRTVARRFADQRRLGASFFFSRGQGDLGHAEKFFTTIASQIARALPALKRHICEAIAEDPRIGTQGLSEQWKKLVFRPLSKLENTSSQCLPIILVIDALDECEREDRKNDVRVILRLLAEAKDLPTIQLKIFLTSRPEVPIHDEFSVISKLNHQDIILHHISNDIIKHDILVFVQYEFERIRRERGLLSDWPKAKDINSIVQDANGLFIYAATICRFIDKRHPEKQLSVILQCIGFSPPTLRTSPTRSLDEMYSQVLKSSIYTNYDVEEREELVGLFKQIVGSIVILSDTLSATALTSLLNLPRRDVDEILKHVQAVLDIPDSLDLPVRLLHPSFRDFLLDKNRCSDLHFWVDERQTHRTLVDNCIRLMSNSLKHDVCRQEAPGTLVADVESSRIEQCLPSEVRYACLYWTQHLQKSNAQLYDNDQVHQFLQVHLLHWLEALGWIGKTSEGILAILSLETQIQADKNPNLYAFIYDAKRFVLYNRLMVDQAPLQLYCSALVFAPENSIVRTQFEEYFPAWIQRKSKVQADWGAVLQTLEGHSSIVSSVAFSPDGKTVVSGSYDKTVRLWDTMTGAALQTLEGHSDSVISVAFSPDSKLIVSGSWDKTVRLWDAVTGAALQILKAHSDEVTSVAFSPDGKLIVSGSYDKTIRLWDTMTGAALQTLEGHSSIVSSVAFSLDGKTVVSGSYDKTVRLWDTMTGAALQTLEGHSDKVMSVAFSPDGKLIVSGSWDKTVRLWDAVTGVALQTLNGHSSIVSSVAFSPDSKLIVSGSWDTTIWLWNAITGAVLQTYKGYSCGISSVAFSLDGELIVSGSYDKVVQLWDAITKAALQTLKGHSDRVNSVAFSLDGKLVVSGSHDETVRIWDAVTGAALQILKGHSAWVLSVAFSPDSKLVVSGSYNKIVQLWDAITGAALQTLKGHSERVTSVAFSPDGKLVASGSYDKIVQLWDAVTGAALQTLNGHSSIISSVAFSPDSKLVVSGSSDNTVRLWDGMTGVLLQTLEGHLDRVMSVGFSLDGKFVVSGSYNETVRLWDAVTGAPLHTLEGHSDKVSSVAFSPDGEIEPTLFVANDWVVEQATRFLWLPPDYRAICEAVWNKAIVLGHSSGEISFLEFKEE